MILSVVSLWERKMKSSAAVYIFLRINAVALFHSADLNSNVVEIFRIAVRLLAHGYSLLHEALLNCLSIATMDALTKLMKSSLVAKLVPGASLGNGWVFHTYFKP